jgi:NitT/TauT family transport system substrate-binding protein
MQQPPVSAVPTVTMMVGGIDKQIYLPYQLAQDFGFYKKYGVNMVMSTEQNAALARCRTTGSPAP